MFKKYLSRIKLTVYLFLIDQISKLFVMLCLGNPVKAPDCYLPVGITYTKSMGFLFGIFLYIPYNRALTIILFALIIWIIQLFFRFYWLRFRRNKLIYSSFSFIIAGFLGNAVDSIVLGYARDIIAIPVLVATNLSDIFIVTGVLLLFIECVTNIEFLKSLPPKRGVRWIVKAKAELEKARPIVTIVRHDVRIILKWLHLS